MDHHVGKYPFLYSVQFAFYRAIIVANSWWHGAATKLSQWGIIDIEEGTL